MTDAPDARSSRPTVACVGELLWDILPTGRHLGGAPANVAFHLSQLGLATRIVTRVGRDALGVAARDALAAHGLPLDDLQWDDALPTGAAHVTLDTSGQASYRFVTPAAWDAIELPAFVPDAVVFGSLAQRDARSAATVREFAGRAAVRVYDVNLRPPHTSHAVLAPSLALATVAKLNAGEAAELAIALDLPEDLPAFAETLAARFDLALVCITRGADGAALWTQGQWHEADGLPVVALDTVGAGDAFLAALIDGWLAGQAPAHVLERANRLGAYVANRRGAMPRHEPRPT